MIRTFLDLSVRAGHAEHLAAAFHRLGILDDSVAQPGCLSAELSVSDDGQTVTVTATWDSPESYAAWTARGDRADLAEHLNVHLERPLDATTVGRVHRVLLQIGGEPLGEPTPCDGAFVSTAEPAEQAKRELDAASGQTYPLNSLGESPG